MSQEIINYGAAPNDGTGDPLRVAFIKTDNNFDQIWAAGPVGSNITILNNTIQVTNTNGNLTLATNGTGVISTRNHVRPNISQVYDIGTANLRYRLGYFTGLNIDGNVTITGNLSAGNISYTSNVFVGDLKGSVFADDSTIMVDAIDNVLRAGAIYTDDYFYANGSPLVSSYGNANVTALLGNLGSNTISGTGNITSTGNISGGNILGNGRQLTGIVSSYGNSNVTTLLGNLGSNTISGTGNITSTGNISGGFILGNISLANGFPATYGNSNVTTLLGNLGSNTISGTGNITTTANISGAYIKGNGSTLTNLPAPAVTQDITSNGSMSIMLYDGTIKYNNYATVEPSSGNIAGGNISAIGNVAGNFFIGNGSQLTGISTADTGNVTFDDVNVIGTGNLNLQPNGSASEYLNIYLTGAADIHVAYGGGSGNVILGTDEEANVAVLQGGNVAIQAGNVAGTKTWTFDTAGNLTLPMDSVVYETNIPDGALSGSAVALKPAGGTTANQQLLIYPTANDGDHIHLTSGNLYTTELFLGSDNLYVKLANTGNVVVNSNDGVGNTAQWIFGTDGRLINLEGLTLTAGGQFNICTILTGGSGYDTGSALKATTGGSGTGMTVGIGYGLSNQLTNADVVDPGTGYVDGDVITVSGGTGGTFVITQYNDQANQGNNNFIESNWTFGAAGNLTLPGNIIAINYANGNRVTGNITFRDEIVIGTGTSNLISGLYLAPSSSSADANMYLRVRGNVNDEPTHIHFDTGNNQYYNQFIGDDNKYIQLANTGNIVINSNDNVGNSAQWTFGANGNLILPSGGNLIVSGAIVGSGASPAPSLSGFSSVSSITLSASGNVTGGNILTAGIVSATGNVSGNFFIGNGSQLTGIAASYGNANVANFLAAYGSNTITTTGNITAGNLIGNISITGNVQGTSSNVTLVAGAYSTVFDNTGNLTLPGNTFAVNYANNTPVPVVTRVEGSWTVPVGNSTQSFTVPINNTYQLWVNCNIPNGIIVYNATVSVSNTNVPAIGYQYAWNYTGGGNILAFTSIPAQIIGTAGAISNASPAVANTNVFSFGINNTSGGNVTVNYGWIQIS